MPFHAINKAYNVCLSLHYLFNIKIYNIVYIPENEMILLFALY